MFKGMLKAEIIRFINIKRILIISVAFIVVLLLGQQDYINNSLQVPYKYCNGVVEILGNALMFDKFKIVMVVLLASIYANSFCTDNNSHYLLMILNRTNMIYYTQARFLVNTVGSILVCFCCFWAAAFLLMPFLPIVTKMGTYDCYYDYIANNMPCLYISLMGLQFGLLIAAFGSIGIAFSAFQSNSFVSIGVAGLAFYLSVSYIPETSVFDVLPVISLAPSFIKSFEGSKIVNLLWGIIYPTVVICISGYVFFKRMEWKIINEGI